MKLYWLSGENRYVHRQADVPKGASVETREIPTDLHGLMGLLNDLHKELAMVSGIHSPPPPSGDDDAFTLIKAGFEDALAGRGVVHEPAACRIVTQIDNPTVPVEDVVETIAKSKGQTLRRYAGAVAVRFEELSKK